MANSYFKENMNILIKKLKVKKTEIKIDLDEKEIQQSRIHPHQVLLKVVVN